MHSSAFRSDTLTILELEHERLGEVLAVLEGELDDMQRGRPFHHGLIHLCFEYLLDYPDACHHPKEDLIAARLQQVSGADSPFRTELQIDHQELHDLTQKVADDFGSIEEDGLATRVFSEVLRGFVETYRRHIATENSRFFPTALSTLSQDDFDAIDFGVFDSPDPILDENDKERFNLLRQSILATRKVS
jgi:hemerythrin-like domain-containing protein